jgi:hypothetical protein
MTPSSMRRSEDAVASEITRWPFGLCAARSPTDSIMCAGRRTPPLAIAAYAVAICIGVTAMPWPIGRLPIEEPE